MAGVLTKTTAGLILAEACANTPATDGWTASLGGTTKSVIAVSSEAAHSASTSWDFQIAADWSPSAYIQLSKSVTIPTGGHPLIRCWRGLAVKGASYDDFLGSALNEWGSRWTGSAAVGNSIATISNTPSTDTPITSIPKWYPTALGQKIRLCARFQFGSGFHASAFFFDNTFGIQTNYDNASYDVGLEGYSFGGGTMATENANMHVYEEQWEEDPGNQYYGEFTAWIDGTQIFASSQTYTGAPTAYGDFRRLSGSDNVYFLDFVSDSYPSAYMCSLVLGSQTLFNNDAVSDYGSALPVVNDFFDECNGWASVTVTGAQTLTMKVLNNSDSLQPIPVHIFWDDIMIMLDKTVQIVGLLGGQVIQLYNSGGTLLFSYTAPSSGQTGTLVSDITPYITSAAGLLGYFKVYNTDGVTLLYTSATAAIWGGDVYTWLPNISSMSATVNYPFIYVLGSGYAPTAATVTVTLVDGVTGSPLSGRTVTFTPNLGSVSPSSATTNSSGQASTVFTAGSLPGLGGVLCNFAGDATYGACAVQQLIDVIQTQPVVKSTVGFQVFVAGQAIVPSGGNYTLSTQFQPQSFEVDTPYMTYSLGGWWLIQIYRFGVLEFVGRIMGRKRQSGTTPGMVITGVDNKVLLQRRVVNTTITDDPANIINDLLTEYPCGISPGTIALYGNTINLVASYEFLSDALAQIQTDTGWLFRLNTNATLDFASTFGAFPNLTITLGTNATLTDYEEDWSQLDTSVTAVGAGTGSSLLTAQVSNPAATLIYGLIEAVSLQKSITTPGALALAAQAILTAQDQTRITITVDFADVHPTGTYHLWDYITVVDPTTGLSGIYQIYSIKRDLTNANYAELVLTNVVISMADILSLVRANVKDLSL
jgi:hypothetical protein